MASPGKWERLRPLRPDTLRVNEVRAGRVREVLPVRGERAGRHCRALLPPRCPDSPSSRLSGEGSLSWKDVAGLGRVMHERGVVWLPSSLLFVRLHGKGRCSDASRSAKG